MSDKETEKQEILDLLGERDKDDDKRYDVFSMDPDDQERMAFCKEWLGVGEEGVYAIGIEYYRQYLSQW
ncbi:MAG: hypothetical protein LUF92_11090 [Clostridiales bacterium]|nr:hypothetical protein [Clostridiales bacterium]